MGMIFIAMPSSNRWWFSIRQTQVVSILLAVGVPRSSFHTHAYIYIVDKSCNEGNDCLVRGDRANESKGNFLLSGVTKLIANRSIEFLNKNWVRDAVVRKR